MKKKTKELDVDFIGGSRQLTKEEQKAISDYIKADKLKRNKKAKKRNTDILNKIHSEDKDLLQKLAH